MQTELLVIGAGPAGMAAAEFASASGLGVTVVDEQPAPGGQILRQPPREFSVSGWLGGRTYRQGKALLRRASENPNLRWLMRSCVAGILDAEAAGIERGFIVFIHQGGGLCRLRAEAVLIAPGCYDMPAIFPGWNLPGVMATGGIQAFVKSQRFVPGDRFAFVGSHPLQLLVADQVVHAGGDVAGVHFAQNRASALRLLRSPGAALRNLGKLARAGAAMRRLERAGVPVHFGRTVLRANGNRRLQSVTVAPLDPNGAIRREAAREVEADRLGICFGFLAASELARQLGATCRWEGARGGWLVCHDEWMCSSVAGIHVAGEITGVAGSEVAEQEGRLAAIGCARALGRVTEARAEALARPIRRRLRALNRFALVLSELSWPGASLFDQLLSDGATLCKCEEVTVGEFLELLRTDPPVETANAAKLLSRVGMGLCQGRYCQYALTRLLARHLDIPEAQVGALTARFPSKPVGIDAVLASDPPRTES